MELAAVSVESKVGDSKSSEESESSLLKRNVMVVCINVVIGPIINKHHA